MAQGFVFRLTVPNFGNLKDELARQLGDEISGLCEWGRGSQIEELVSAPVTRTVLDQAVSAFDRLGVQYRAEDLSSEYVHVVTDSHKSYDYGYVLDLFTEKNQWGKIDRHVAIPRKNFEYQNGRYASGFHTGRVVP